MFCISYFTYRQISAVIDQLRTSKFYFLKMKKLRNPKEEFKYQRVDIAQSDTDTEDDLDRVLGPPLGPNQASKAQYTILTILTLEQQNPSKS